MVHSQLLLGLFIWLNHVLCEMPIYYGQNIKEDGVKCGFIKALPNSREPYVAIQAKSKSNIPGYKLELPVLIINKVDLNNLINFSNETHYDELYKHNRTVLFDEVFDYSNNKFNLSMGSAYQLDETAVYNGLLSLDKENIQKEVRLPVKVSGNYCIFIAPPTDVSLNDILISTSFINSHGKLIYEGFLLYEKAKHYLVLSILIFGYLHVTIQRNKDRNNIEVVSYSSLYYILLPYIFVQLFTWFTFYLENNYLSPPDFGNLTYIFSKGYFLSVRYFKLLFAMGYGSLYNCNDKMKNYSKMPSKSFYRSNMLLIFNFILVLVSTWKSNLVLEYILWLLPGIWYILTCINYFRTRRLLIDAYPAGSIDNKIRAFKRSIYFLFIQPIIRPFVLGIGIVYLVIEFVFALIRSNEPLKQEEYFNSAMHFLILDENLKIYLIVGLAHFVWFNSNKTGYESDVAKKMS
ncbi:uncharacterized protein RJT21DRAFT_13703 [Scheffersomyces amazonensis]|uniref:uncharacterized protein n=1 Tax=Scheffersomyces amazonensis TaxID=1078765 RepID=UPI00315CAA39